MHDLVINKHGAFEAKSDTRWKYPTAFSSWGIEEAEATERVFTRGRFTMGPEVEAFEHQFAGYHRMTHGIMVNSGSSANLIMIAALFATRRLNRGDVAVVPAIAWSTTYAPLVQYDLRLQLVDVDESWNSISPDVQGAKLVVGCSILGNPAPLDFLRTAADAHDAIFIEDNCESLGAYFGNDLCGTFGLMSSFSFFYSHQISAIEGGMILTNDAELAKACRVLRAHGWTRDIQPPSRFEDEYNFTQFGYNVRPLELHAAIAAAQLQKLNGFVRERAKNMRYFRALTKELPVKHQQLRTLDPSPFGMPFTVPSPEIRARLVAAFREAGIDCRLPTGGSFRKQAYGAAWSTVPTPGADRIHDTGLFIGNAPWPIDDLIEGAVKVMKEVL